MRRTRDGKTVSWEYDAAGRRTCMTLPDGSTVGYHHGAAGRVAATASDLIQSWEYADGFVVGHTVADASGAVRTAIGRDEDGRIRSIDRDGTTTTFDYDAACQLVESRVCDQHVRWRYDAAGRLIGESGGLTGGLGDGVTVTASTRCGDGHEAIAVGPVYGFVGKPAHYLGDGEDATTSQEWETFQQDCPWESE